ncbi:MAG TPA: DUF4198 domain-containing protein [Vicinamibacteria bacterium]|nr:DUF4198 domain-containing protein [Vicinamibacteria bacterium]
MTRRSAPRSPVGGVLALLLLFSSPGFAHDLWILPGKYRLRADEVTRVFVNNGDVFPESLTLLGKERLSEVLSVSSAGELPISEFRVDGKSLTFDFQSAAPGSHVIVLGTRPRTVRMKGEVFEDYLAVEGLTAIAAIRKELGQTSEPAVERYAKWAKAIVDVGDEPGTESVWAENAGQPFEIVPLDHPNRVQPGGALRLRVLLDGEPLAGVSVTGARASGPAKEISATTDERGEAAVTVTAPGRWYVRAIHMIRLEGAPEASWASYWATLSFEVQSTAGSGY